MMMLLQPRPGAQLLRRPDRAGHAATVVPRSAGRPQRLVCRAEDSGAPSSPADKAPEWAVPEQAGPLVNFLASDNFSLEKTDLYSKYLKRIVDDELFAQSIGWKAIPEQANGRAAMIGFVAAAGAEVLGAGSVLTQFSKAPQVVVVVLALIVASTIIPIYKGTNGGYLTSLLDTYSLPPGVFTATNERVHGRLAMLGLGSLLAIELVLGRALL